MSIRIFVTGGTFDKEYNERTGQLFFQDTHLPEMLKLGRSRVEVDIRTLMMIDSLEMTDMDRELIARHCEEADEDKIIITHGTGHRYHVGHRTGAGRKSKRQDHCAHRRHDPL
jgi:L-asparaginase